MRRFSDVVRPLSFVILFGAAILMATGTVRAEKVPKPPEGKEAPPVNKTAEVHWGSKWYAAQILEEKDGKFHIHYNGESDSSNEWVPKDRVRFPSKPKGETKCEVEWGGKWYPAHVIAEGGDGQWKIKYDNDSDSWNEWVGKDRIRLLPRNPDFEPIEVMPDQDFAIEGLYCGLVRPNR